VSGAVKTGLIVVGVGAGAYVLLKLLAPSPITGATKPRAGTDLVGGISGIIGAAGALKGLFGSSTTSSQAAAVIDTPTGLMATRQEWQNISAYDSQGTASNPVYGIAGLDY
jgi:CheY-specific phosphatase CheX